VVCLAQSDGKDLRGPDKNKQNTRLMVLKAKKGAPLKNRLQGCANWRESSRKGEKANVFGFLWGTHLVIEKVEVLTDQKKCILGTKTEGGQNDEGELGALPIG